MQVKLGLFQDVLRAYDQPELFEKVKLKMEEQYDNVKFILPVCIEAVPACECDCMFIVKPNHKGGHVFAPRKKDAIEFATIKQAQEYIDNTLKPAYGEKWTYQVWSLASIPK